LELIFFKPEQLQGNRNCHAGEGKANKYLPFTIIRYLIYK